MEEFHMTNKTIPKFEVYTTQVRHAIKINDTKHQIESDAIKIVAPKDSAEWLTMILLEATRETKWTTGIFVPFQWKQRESTTMFNLLDSHNTWLHSIKALAILGIHKEVMRQLRINATNDPDRAKTVYRTLTTTSGDSPDHPVMPLIWAVEESLDT
jgi:hypothetical protein